MMNTQKAGLVADVGATNARFAVVDREGIYDQLNLKCDDFPGIADAARHYLKESGNKRSIQSGAFAVAGPVGGDRFELTNHTWSFSVSKTSDELGLESLNLLNDFEAIALAVPHLKRDDIIQIGDGTPEDGGTIGVLGPGTGLGVASLFWDGQQYRPNPCEGGHVTMPAKVQREFDIFRTLRYKYRHVSAERVCSGKGLVNIYNAIRILDGRYDLPERNPEEISACAIDQSCSVCSETLTLMIGFLGSVAGNLALSLGASGGIYIAGGIPAKLGETFIQSAFRDEFLAKGRFESYLTSIPTYLITHPSIAFVGLQADLIKRSAV